MAECYLDNLAVRLESVRPGKGQGYRRFLVFAELTKSKKGAEYVALFTYFSFQSFIRTIICSGPRQVVNGLTLYAVWNAKGVGTEFGQIDSSSVGSTLSGFFQKIKLLAGQDVQQSLILSGMLFSMIVWLFYFIFLVAAVIFYVTFLWHWIPKSDNGLSGYCERKINKRLMQIVSIKVNKAIAEEERARLKAGMLAAQKTGEKPILERQATIPNVESPADQDKLPEMPMLNRNDTMTTLPAYTSRPASPGGFELDALDQKRPMPSRSNTTVSNSTAFSSRAPLMPGASEMGYGRPSSPAPSVPSVDLNNYPPVRPGTAASNRNMGPPMGSGLQRTQTNGSSYSQGYTASPATYSSETMPSMPRPVRSPTAPADGSHHRLHPSQGSMDSMRGAAARPYPSSRPTYDDYSSIPRRPSNATSSGGSMGGQPYPSSRPTYDDYTSIPRRGSNAASSVGSMGGQPSPRTPGPMNGPVPAYASMRSATNPLQGRPGGPQINVYPTPQRNMTAPVPQRQQPSSDDYFNRPPTAQSQRGPAGRGPGGYGGYGPDLERGGPRY